MLDYLSKGSPVLHSWPISCPLSSKSSPFHSPKAKIFLFVLCVEMQKLLVLNFRRLVPFEINALPLLRESILCTKQSKLFGRCSKCVSVCATKWEHKFSWLTLFVHFDDLFIWHIFLMFDVIYSFNISLLNFSNLFESLVPRKFWFVAFIFHFVYHFGMGGSW